MGSPTIRPAAVAGKFYPQDPKKLLASIHSYISEEPRQSALGCVVPHAGYMYSGHVAGAVYARVEVGRRCIVLCPNHTGQGTPLSIMVGRSGSSRVRVVPDSASALRRPTRR